MRRSLLALVVVLLGLALAPYPSSPASASCVGPSLDDKHLVLTHGGEQTVTGQYFFNGCEDSVGCDDSPGCSSCEPSDPQSPRTDVGLRIAQHGRTWSLGTVDADADYRTSWSFELPPDVTPGRATLLPDGAQPVEVRIR